MASSPEFVQYITEQLSGAGAIRSLKMFGEYGIYCDGKIIGLICDNQFYVKITEAGARILSDPIEAPPYEGAKPYFLIENPDDSELMTLLVQETWRELPAPKPKKRAAKKEPRRFQPED